MKAGKRHQLPVRNKYKGHKVNMTNIITLLYVTQESCEESKS